MELKSDFAFRPLPPIPAPVKAAPSTSPLGPLADLVGRWSGTGFNVIWRPNKTPPGPDHFLELNLTKEDLEFVEIPGEIPNRGLLQGDINMFGLRYLQQIKDANVIVGGANAGLHVEPGLWAFVPTTTNPAEGETVVRMASIPHGTTILAQGSHGTENAGPNIQKASITPFVIGQPTNLIPFVDSDLSKPSANRSKDADIVGITQTMVDDPNSVLTAALAGQVVSSTTTLVVSTLPRLPILGGGVANTAFLQGGAGGPNAQAAIATAIFWIERLKGQNGAPDSLQLQYTQTVLLNFAGLSWPHVTVATLTKLPAAIG
jgi:hypothetical protein